MLKRDISKVLLDWSKSKDHKPLLIRGARQVGKTHAVETLAGNFKSFVSLNLELESDYRTIFDNLDPHHIISTIGLKKGREITPGKTLLFLDEIQACPNAITALRYFREKIPELHVISAGSLLEFVLNQESISIPVGRIEYLYMYPCSFTEYLQNVAPHSILDQFKDVSVDHPFSRDVHEALLSHYRNYMIIGGMPEAVSKYVEEKDIYAVQRIQNAILQTYQDDFGKYASLSKHQYLQTVYRAAPGMVGEQISYVKIDPDVRSRELKSAIQLLEYAGLLRRIICTSASGLPLITTANEKKIKLLFLDIGLVQRATGLSVEMLLNQDFEKLNQGSLAEQVVGQALLAEQDPFSLPELFYWARDAKNSQAEIDYILNCQGQILPIEVKSGAKGKLKSMMVLLNEKKLPLGVKISMAPLSWDAPILNIPFYLLGELERLVKDYV